MNVGDNNIIQDKAEYSTLLNTTNAIVYQDARFATIVGGNNNKVSGSNATIIASNTSSMNNAVDAVIIAGNDSSILNSDKSVIIGQDTSIVRGNSNIAIGNFDTNQRSVTDMINIVSLNANRDIESYENLGGDDFDGHAYLGSHRTIGAVFSDHKEITMSPGGVLWLTGSAYANDYIYKLGWSGGNGTANIYLPSTDPLQGDSRDATGYKRMIRFIGDNTLTASTKININVSGSDAIDGATGGWYEVSKAYEGIMVYGVSVGEWFVIQKKA